MAWIRSKHEYNQGMVINVDNLASVAIGSVTRGDEESDWEVVFISQGGHYSWVYNSKEDRDQEFEWIMSILDYKVNDGNPGRGLIDPLNTKYIMRSPLDIKYGKMGTIETGEIVLSIYHAEKLEPEEICVISYMDSKFWCEAGKLKPLE